MLASIVAALALQCPDGTPPPCARAASRGAAAANSIAVLYFENNSPDTADIYLADGLTDELITQLGRIERLALAPRSSVRRFRNSAVDVAAAARALNVSHVLTGSVRRAGARLRVDVELVRLPSLRRLWGESYQRSDGDLFAIQEDIARSITRAIAGTLLPGERAALARAPTRDPAAYDLYLRGSRHIYDVSPEGAQRMLTLFEEALRRDSLFTAARGRLAYVYGWIVNWGLSLPGLTSDSVIATGMALADRAIREDSASSDAWAGRSFLLFFKDPPDYARSLDGARRAVQLDSTNPWALQQYSTIARRLGDFDTALRALQRAVQHVPDFTQALADIGFNYLSRRRYREALPWYDSAAVVSPNAWSNLVFRARVRLALGDTAGAQADARRSLALVPPASRHLAQSLAAVVAGASGDTAAARALIDPIAPRFATGQLAVRDGYELAAGLIASGRSDAALDVLERVRPRGAWLWSYLVFADFDALRGNARFRRIFEEARPPGAPPLP